MSTTNDEQSGALVTPLELSVEGPASHPMVTARGELDVATSPRLRSELMNLIARGAQDVTLKFAGVSFVDSSGLGVLVGAYKRLQADGRGALHITGAQPAVRKVFEITGLAAVLLDD
jgi:anti-sigma B factor antagonist